MFLNVYYGFRTLSFRENILAYSITYNSLLYKCIHYSCYFHRTSGSQTCCLWSCTSMSLFAIAVMLRHQLDLPGFCRQIIIKRSPKLDLATSKIYMNTSGKCISSLTNWGWRYRVGMYPRRTIPIVSSGRSDPSSTTESSPASL